MTAPKQANTRPRKRRCGTGPGRFRLAMMACGLNVSAAASHLQAPKEMVLEWAQMDTAPSWAMEEMRLLHARILQDDTDLPKASADMCDLLRAWGNPA